MKLTQKELAKHLQIADSTLSYWEIGKYEPDSEALMKLSRFFKVPIDHILGGDFGMRVSENVPTYNFQNEKTKLDRVEFDDLTHEEIDLLAEYALFIKSRRKT